MNLRRGRKPYGVWMLVPTSGDPWLFCRERDLQEALLTARTLRGGTRAIQPYAVWIAPPDPRQAYLPRPLVTR